MGKKALNRSKTNTQIITGISHKNTSIRDDLTSMQELHTTTKIEKGGVLIFI